VECPHCRHKLAPEPRVFEMKDGRERRSWRARITRCPNCSGDTVELTCVGHDGFDWRRVHPLGMQPILPAGVPDRVARLHREAALLVSVSPTFSAVASRRCLEGVLKLHGYGERAGQRRDPVLADRVKAFVSDATTPHAPPSDLKDAIDAVRHLGNSGAHPGSDAETGDLFEATVEDAEDALDLVEAVLVHFYGQSQDRAARWRAFREGVARRTKRPT
jgi:hypothetical protein